MSPIAATFPSVVSNSPFRVPVHPLIDRVIVSDGFDAADDWIAEAAAPRAVVITADILLADRCLKAGAQVVSPTGKPFTADRSARRSRPARSWPICARGAPNSAARRRSQKPIARVSCRRSIRR